MIILSMKWELAANTPLNTSYETIQGSQVPHQKQISSHLSRNNLWQKSPPDSRALLDLLNKQTSDSNLSMYTGADLHCKWSSSLDTTGRMRQFSDNNKGKALMLSYPQLDLFQPSLMEALSLLAFCPLKGIGTSACGSGGPSRHWWLCKPWCRFGGT